MKMPVKIFIAARRSSKALANEIGDQLQFIGCAITSRWHSPEIVSCALPSPHPEKAICAQMNLDDVDSCEVLVLLDSDNTWEISPNKHHEFGYAIAKKKHLIWWHLGTMKRPDLLYSQLPQVHSIYSWEELLEVLAKC